MMWYAAYYFSQSMLSWWQYAVYDKNQKFQEGNNAKLRGRVQNERILNAIWATFNTLGVNKMLTKCFSKGTDEGTIFSVRWQRVCHLLYLLQTLIRICRRLENIPMN